MYLHLNKLPFVIDKTINTCKPIKQSFCSCTLENMACSMVDTTCSVFVKGFLQLLAIALKGLFLGD
jgi:hypothetical protein